MLDITNEQWFSNRFGGSEKKRTLVYDGKVYMVKFPDPSRSTKRTELSYINNQFSEHVGCAVFRILGIPAQNTFLATCIDPMSKKEKIVVACEIFGETGGARLIEFSKVLLNDTDSNQKRAVTIEAVMDVLDDERLISNRDSIKQYFWNMFVVDALIGNSDRHFDNWGLLESDAGEFSPAPVYDCGSSLSPLKSDAQKEGLLKNDSEFKQQEYNLNSVYRMNGKRILYHEIFREPPPHLRAAILRIVPRIQERAAEIDAFIDETEGLSDIAKEYMKKSIALRKEQILFPALKR